MIRKFSKLILIDNRIIKIIKEIQNIKLRINLIVAGYFQPSVVSIYINK